MTLGRHGRQSRWWLVLLPLGLIVGQQVWPLPSTAAERGAPRSFVIDLHSVGGMPVAGATYRSALRHFKPLAPDISTVFQRNGCGLISAKLGLHIEFESFFGNRGTSANCTLFGEAVATGSRWRTGNGLRIGAPIRALRRLFPRAYDTKVLAQPVHGVPPGSTDWDLASAPRIGLFFVLVAFVRHDRVAGFAVERAGH